jgi:hypothetical protein
MVRGPVVRCRERQVLKEGLSIGVQHPAVVGLLPFPISQRLPVTIRSPRRHPPMKAPGAGGSSALHPTNTTCERLKATARRRLPYAGTYSESDLLDCVLRQVLLTE